MIALNTLQAQIRPNTQFGYNASNIVLPKIGRFMKTFDFHTPGDTWVKQSMLIYICIISSRLLAARSNNERLETPRRDPLGWYSWFFGMPLFEQGLILLMTHKNPEVRQLLLRKVKAGKSKWDKFKHFINPTGRYVQTSLQQLNQRKTQIVDQMLAKGASPDTVKNIKNLFSKASLTLNLTSFFSLMFTIFTLGIGINILNIAMTRKSMSKNTQPQTFNAAPPFQGL